MQCVGREKSRVRNWLKENVTLKGGYAWTRWDWSVVDARLRRVWFDISAATLRSPPHSDSSPSTTWFTVVLLIWGWMTLIIDKRWLACTMIMTLSAWVWCWKHDGTFQKCLLKVYCNKHINSQYSLIADVLIFMTKISRAFFLTLKCALPVPVGFRGQMRGTTSLDFHADKGVQDRRELLELTLPKQLCCFAQSQQWRYCCPQTCHWGESGDVTWNITCCDRM